MVREEAPWRADLGAHPVEWITRLRTKWAERPLTSANGRRCRRPVRPGRGEPTRPSEHPLRVEPSAIAVAVTTVIRLLGAQGREKHPVDKWRAALRLDPVPALAASEDAALAWHLRAEVLDSGVPSKDALWALPEVSRILKKQQPGGFWRYPKQPPPPTGNYDLLETFRQLRVLVQIFQLDAGHPALVSSVEWVLSCQTADGDIRGILGNQYMPYYHGMILALVIEAGYGDDPRIEAGLEWLLRMRQDDGGWIVPAQAVPPARKTLSFWNEAPLAPDRARPNSHLATGMALRALAVHPRFRRRKEARAAAERLKESFFRAEKYNDRKAPGYWTKLGFPYWWTDLLMALDSVTLIEPGAEDPHVAAGVRWFIDHQDEDGLWPTGYGSGSRAEVSRQWVGLRACTVLK